MGALRVLTGLVIALGMAGAWMLLACAVMLISLYVARIFPLTGRHKPRPRV